MIKLSNLLGEVRNENNQRFICGSANYTPNVKNEGVVTEESERERELVVSRGPLDDDDDTRSMTMPRNLTNAIPLLMEVC